jgi:hypothetical protein
VWNGTAIANANLANSSFYVGTTSISLGRGSASQTLTGVSIDGNAATVTNGVYTSGDQSISGTKTFSGTISMGSATRQMLNLYNTSYGIGIQSSTQYFRTDGRFSWFNGGVHSDTENTPGSGGTTLMTLASNGNLTVTGTIGASNFSGSHSGTSSGTNTGDQTNISGNAATATLASNSSGLNGLSKSQLWNNSGQSHGAYNSFSGITDFGEWFVHQDAGVTDGPSGLSYQYYVKNVGLGNDYPYSGAGSYAMQTAINRYGYGTTFYTWIRFKENNGWQSWNKMAAGYADTAGNITAYTINQNVGTGNSPTFAGVTTTGAVTIGNSLSGANCLNLNRVGGYPTIKGVTTNGGDGQIVIDGASNSSNVYLNNYVSSNVYLATGGGTTYVGALIPHSNNAYNLGSASAGWANVYTNDLHLSNMNKPEGNDIDGTNGTWTIQEGAENLYIINNNNGKKYKIDLTEIK